MNKVVSLAVAVLMLGGIAAAGEGTGCPMMKKEASKACADGKKGAKCLVKGTVEAVDAEGMKLTVKDAKGEVKEVVLNAETKLTGKGVKALADIAVGDKVDAKIVGDVAAKVSVKKAKAAKKAKEKKAKAEKKAE